MEKRVIATNPIFKEIVEICWKDAGGTDEMDSLETERSYKKFIPEAIQKQWPGAVLSPDQVIGLWGEMRNFGLAVSERVKKERTKWKKFLINPKGFNWETSKKPGYLWFKRKSAREETTVAEVAPEVNTEVVLEEELSPEAIMEDELTAAQVRVGQLEEKKNGVEQEINRLEELISQFQKILEVYEGLIKLEQEKISLLQPEQEGTNNEGKNSVPIRTNQE